MNEDVCAALVHLMLTQQHVPIIKVSTGALVVNPRRIVAITVIGFTTRSQTGTEYLWTTAPGAYKTTIAGVDFYGHAP